MRERSTVGTRRGDLTPEKAEERRHFRRSYVLANSFEFFIAVAAVIAALRFIGDPQAFRATTVAQNAGVLAWLWNALYLLGGLMIIVGIVWPRIGIEAAGISLFSSAAVINGTSLMITAGSVSIAAAAVYFSFAAGGAGRVYLLSRMLRTLRERS